MLKQASIIGLMAAGLCGMQAACAQSPQEPATQEQQVDLQQARADLDQARRQMEQAARTIATQVQFAPELENLNRDLRNFYVDVQDNFIYAGPSRIGATVVDSELGALVTRVTPGSGAETAGLKVGDVIQSVDGVSVATADQGPARSLMSRVREAEPGETVALVVERAGQTLELDVETSQGSPWVTVLPGGNEFAIQRFNVETPNVSVAAPGMNFLRSWNFASSPWGEMELVAVSEGLGRYFDTSEGLLVVTAPEDDAIDIQDGDVILSISGRTPNSPEHAIRILSSFESGETIEFSIMRDGRSRTVEYTVPEGRNARMTVGPRIFSVPAPAAAPAPPDDEALPVPSAN